MPPEKNTKAKTRDVNNPYEVFIDDRLGWEWRVLKHYQTPTGEQFNTHARTLCAVKSPYTYGSYDLGDTYMSDYKLMRQLEGEDLVNHVKANPW